MPSAPSLELIAACGSKKQRQRKDESIQDFVARITHLDLTRKQLLALDNINACRKLLALYLYENRIAKITNLNSCTNLTHLYLQDNAIERLEGINRLKHLTKLFIGRNKIIVLEGLHDLTNLRELHIEHQDMPPGEKLLVDPRTLFSLQRTVRHLNLAGNNLDDVSEFAAFSRLKTVDVSHNKLTDLNQIRVAFGDCHQLHTLNVTGNPFCLLTKYREEIVVMVQSLRRLDGRDITPTMRQFLNNWKSVLDHRRKKGLAHTHRRPPPPPSARYRKPTFKRQGVAVAPKYRSRLRPTPSVLPPLQAQPAPTTSDLDVLARKASTASSPLK